MQSLRLKKLIVTKVIGLVAVAVLTGALIRVGQMVLAIRDQTIAKQLKLEASLDSAVHQAALVERLVKHEKEIKRIRTMVPGRDEISQVVELIEREAKSEGVAVLVPRIGEEPVYDENGVVIERTGPASVVRLKIEGVGDPLALLNFMHAVEHLPYLLRPVSFTLEKSAGAAAVGRANVAPVGPGPSGQPEPMKTLAAVLKVDLLLTTWVQEGN